MTRTLLAALAAAGLLAAGCSAGGPATPASPAGPASSSGPAASPGLSWRGCPQVAPGLQCATLRVPLSRYLTTGAVPAGSTGPGTTGGPVSGTCPASSLPVP